MKIPYCKMSYDINNAVSLRNETITHRLIIWWGVKNWIRAWECELIVVVLTRIYPMERRETNVCGCQIGIVIEKKTACQGTSK